MKKGRKRAAILLIESELSLEISNPGSLSRQPEDDSIEIAFTEVSS
jgi:hypothetical protein